MLNEQEQELLNKAYADIVKKYSRALLPEEEELFEKQFKSNEDFSGPGYHIHDTDNPTGKHRHNIEDKIDGAHRHTFINKRGEHVHGHFEGMASADGDHWHDYGGLGYHSHEDGKTLNGQDLIPEKPDSVL